MILQKITNKQVTYENLTLNERSVVHKEINRIQSMIRITERLLSKSYIDDEIYYNITRLHTYLEHVRKDVYESFSLTLDDHKYNKMFRDLVDTVVHDERTPNTIY